MKRPPVRQVVTLAVNSSTTFGLTATAELHKDVRDLVARLGDTHLPFHHYQEVTRALAKNHTEWKVQGVWPSIVQALLHMQALKLPPRDQLLAWVTPPKLLDSLYEYQKDGVAFALGRGGRCLIADEPGVGKTRQGLAILASYRQEWPCMVLCPSSLTGQWVKYVKEWLQLETDEPAHFVKCIRKGTDAMDALVNVVSYDLAASKEVELQARNFQVVVADESHSLKSRTAKRTQALVPVLSRAKRVILMSGTPALNRPSELFSQLFLLRRDIFHNFHEFGVRYCAARKEHFGWNYDGSSNLDELHTVLEATCVIRRRKGEVLQELPEKTREKVSLTLTDEQLDLVAKSIKHLQDVTSREMFVDATTQQAAFLSVVRDVGKAKIPSTIQYLSTLLDEGEKVVLFSHHTLVRDEVQRYLERRRVKFIRIDGHTPPAARTRQVDEFQDDDDVRVALLSITAAGTGTTLTAAHIVVFAELLFTPASLLQAEDRCHRIGQAHPVSVRYLVAKGTAEERVWGMLYNKFDVLGRVMGDTSSFRAHHVQYDEEITQTDMKEFIAALLGGPPPTDATLLGAPLTDVADVTTDTTATAAASVEWNPAALGSEKKRRKTKKTIRLDHVIMPTSWSRK